MNQEKQVDVEVVLIWSCLIKVSALLCLIKCIKWKVMRITAASGSLLKLLPTDPSLNLWVCVQELTPGWTQLGSKVRVEGWVRGPKQRCKVEGQVTVLWRMHSVLEHRLLLDKLSYCNHDGSSGFVILLHRTVFVDYPQYIYLLIFFFFFFSKTRLFFCEYWKL